MFCLEMYFRKIRLGITSKRFCAYNNKNGILSFRMQGINQILMLSITHYSIGGVFRNFCLLILLFDFQNKRFIDISFLHIEMTLISLCLMMAIQSTKCTI